ncbi:MAG: hypothetical protein IKN17_12410 [Ruminococcus sp.]|nr:hypothetical protein [Ruminococcus sp.]
MKAETKKLLLSRERGKAELIVFIAYMISVAVIGIFHEPWFDEAQAWSIARSASFHDIIFEVGHYEGHPPLWSLLLSPFAKLGAPYELSLKAVNLVICAAAVWVILYKSPFPKIVRCVMPFTFFFFYQTAVICRPYSLMMLAFTLLAAGYRRRNEKPLRYVLPMLLLCASHAYGLILAGGLCIVWTVEIFAAAIREKRVSSLFKDKRCYMLLGILAFAVFTVLLIIPADDVRYMNMDVGFTDRLSDLKMLLVYPIDSLFGIYIDLEPIKMTESGLITTMIGGAMLWVVLILVTKRNKKLAVFSVPYLMFLLFGIFKYMYWNHIGISTFFLMFTVWIILDDEEPAVPEVFRKITSKVESKLTVVLAKAAVIGMAAMPLSWTAYCTVSDIMEPYGMRDVAQYIKDNDIEGHTIMMYWLFEYKGGDRIFDPDNYYAAENRRNLSNEQSDGSALSPYFDTNIFYNFNITHHDDLFNTFKITTEEDNERNFALWREYGYPEYMFCKCPLNSVFPELTYKDIDEMYVLEASFERNCFFKFSAQTEGVQIYRLKDEYIGKGKPQ